MKKILAIILVLCTCCLTSCSLFITEYEGLETFGEGNSDMSLCQEVIPSGMISKFEYSNGNHFFISKYELTKYEVQKVLLYLTYDADTYTDAKAFASTNLHLVERSDETVSNYVFFDNYGYEKFYKEGRGMVDYPNFYRMVAFDDDNYTIVFFGMYIPDNSIHLGNDDSPTTFDDHLKYFYGDWYDFFA